MSASVSERERLLTYVEQSRGHFSLALAGYDDGEDARALWEQLIPELHARGCLVVLVDFSGAVSDIDVMHRFEAASAGADALFVVGLEQLLIGEDDRPRPTRAVVKLNFDRDLLPARVPTPVVLWLSHRGAQAFAMLAPDTYDVLRTTFELAAAKAEPDDLLDRRSIATSSPESSRPRWLRLAPLDQHPRFEARHASLHSLHADPNLQPEQAGDLSMSLAEACFALGRNDEGGRWLHEAAQQYERAGSLGAAVTARRRATELHLFWNQPEAAQLESDRAWALTERMLGSEDPLIIARARPDVVAVRNLVESTRTRAKWVPDFDLLERWRSGDREAGSRLLARHFSRLRTYFRARVPEASVEDLVQEVFLRMVQALPRFEGRSSFGAYLFGIARNVMREYQRGRERQTDAAPLLDDDFATGLDLEAKLADGQTLELLLDALHAMPADAQDLLLLRYFEGLTLAELAEVFEIPVRIVTSLLHHARTRLAAAYTNRTGTLGELDVETRLPELARRLSRATAD